MRKNFLIGLAVLAFSAAAASADGSVRLEKDHDASGYRFGEYRASHEASAVQGGTPGGLSGPRLAFPGARSAAREAAGRSPTLLKGPDSSPAEKWRIGGGAAAIVAGVLLFAVPLVLGLSVPVLGASLLILGGILALIYPWK